MRNKGHIQHHPNQEDKTGKPSYASATGVNSSTTRRKPDAMDVPEGAESDYKNKLMNAKKAKPTLSKRPKQ